MKDSVSIFNKTYFEPINFEPGVLCFYLELQIEHNFPNWPILLLIRTLIAPCMGLFLNRHGKSMILASGSDVFKIQNVSKLGLLTTIPMFLRRLLGLGGFKTCPKPNNLRKSYDCSGSCLNRFRKGFKPMWKCLQLRF